MPPSLLDSRRLVTLQRALLAWYDRCRRELPWRERESDAYAQLVAELMLQQTQAERVIPYYRRFMAAFPTLCDLADAPIDDVLALWSGLGYYSRARNLHRAAQQVVQHRGGHMPQDLEGLMTLPGVGRYTAGAIASVAYDLRVPILDGNVARVLTRWEAISDDSRGPAVRERLWSLAEAILPRRRCGHFNQSLMELGATVCTPKSPACAVCPVARWCEARIRRLTDSIPRPAVRAKARRMHMAVALMVSAGKVLLRRRPADGLWGGLWEPPSQVAESPDSLPAARRLLRASLPVACRLAVTSERVVERTLTHRQISLHVYHGTASRAGPLPEGWRWAAAADCDRLGLSNAAREVIQAAGPLANAG